jgi:hypothetical protein
VDQHARDLAFGDITRHLGDADVGLRLAREARSDLGL